jgi:hypothetical protein
MSKESGHQPKANFGLSRDAYGDLVMIDAEGGRHVGVVPLRMFPFSDRERWISLIDADNKEVLLIEDVTLLPRHLFDLIQEELANREFLPVVERVIHVTSDLEPCEWQVLTDRGTIKFVLKTEDDVRSLGPGKSLIVDATGMRYLVPDYRKMDSYSRRVMEEYA